MRLDQRLRAFNEMRGALLDEMEALDPAKLVARPRVGKWSILEIVEHLVLAERSRLGAFRVLLTSRTKRLLVLDRVIDTAELEELRGDGRQPPWPAAGARGAAFDQSRRRRSWVIITARSRLSGAAGSPRWSTWAKSTVPVRSK
jgi:DinB superfamily